MLPYKRMNKLLPVIFATIFLGGCTIQDVFVKAPAGLSITTSPQATVFINDENRGETPFTDKEMKPGSYSIKLVPSEDNLVPYETKIELTSKASAIISRNFAPSEIDSSGYVLQLQEDPGGSTYLSVISDPDNVNVTLDDVPSGFTPLSKLPINPGAHSLHVTSPGFSEQALPINATSGYNLIVSFKLAGQSLTLTPPSPSPDPASLESPTASLSASASPSPTPASTPTLSMEKPYVIIGETETGWLRVRKEASGTSDEIGKVDTGEQLKYLGESTELGWFKIEFEGQVGWVSGRYVTLVK